METTEITTLELAFSKVRLQTHSGVAAVRRPAVLLTAIDQTLAGNGNGNPLTPVDPSAYLIALISTIEQLVHHPQSTVTHSDQRELLDASLYLLALLVPHLASSTTTTPLLRPRAATLTRLLLPLFPAFHSTQATPALKSLVTITEAILLALPAPTILRDLPSRTLYSHLLALAADHRPKLRRRAQEAILAVLSHPPVPSPPGAQHPYAPETAQWILNKLAEAVKGAKRGGKSDLSTTATAEATSSGSGKAKAQAAAKVIAGDQAGGGPDGSHGSDESRAIALLTFIKNLGTSWDAQASRCFFFLSSVSLSY